MKKIFILVLISLGLCANAFAEDRLIQVSGVAEKGMDPNMVSMTLEIWAKGSSAKQAQAAAAAQHKSVRQVLENFKIKKEDIQTENYALNPEYQWDQKTQTNKMLGFKVVQSLNVTLRQIETAGQFLDALVSDKKTTDAGMNVNSIVWDSDKRSQVEVAALGDAVRAAKVKAEEIAKAAGVKIKNVSRISHATGGVRPMMENARFVKSMASDAAPTELSGGQVKVRVEVTAEYEIN